MPMTTWRTSVAHLPLAARVPGPLVKSAVGHGRDPAANPPSVRPEPTVNPLRSSGCWPVATAWLGAVGAGGHTARHKFPVRRRRLPPAACGTTPRSPSSTSCAGTSATPRTVRRARTRTTTPTRRSLRTPTPSRPATTSSRSGWNRPAAGACSAAIAGWTTISAAWPPSSACGPRTRRAPATHVTYGSGTPPHPTSHVHLRRGRVRPPPPRTPPPHQRYTARRTPRVT